MGVFRLFKEKKYFRLILFISLVFIITTFRTCDNTTVHGFPTVVMETGEEYHSEEDNYSIQIKSFNKDNLVINIVLMVLLFLVIEKFRKIISKKILKIFDISFFFVISYLTITFTLFLIVELLSIYIRSGIVDYIGFPVITLLWPIIYTGLIFMNFYESNLIKSKGIDWFWEHRDYTILRDYFQNHEDFFFRIGILVFSIILFFLIYYIAKWCIYYKGEK